jgi:hypothetical protein
MIGGIDNMRLACSVIQLRAVCSACAHTHKRHVGTCSLSQSRQYLTSLCSAAAFEFLPSRFVSVRCLVFWPTSTHSFTTSAAVDNHNLLMCHEVNRSRSCCML